MTIIRLDPELEKKMKSIAGKTGVSVEWLANEAVRTLLEDKEDHAAAIAVLEKDEPAIGLNELKRRLRI
jgi:predicted transcriptional regulator